MDGNDVYFLIFGMALATYIPRALPALCMDRMHFGKRFQRFLTLLPYTAMSALIFPGVLSVDDAHPLFGISGALLAGLLALKKSSLIVCVLGAVVLNCMLYIIF